jgi:UDP-glucose 4-epimerase
MGTGPGLSGEIFNIGPDREFITIRQLAATIAQLMGVPHDPIFVPGRPREVRYATCAGNKARMLLAYDPRTSLDDGLALMISWIRERGPRPFRYDLPIEIDAPSLPDTWRSHLI